MRQIEVINLETIIDVTAETSNVEILVQDYDAELVERFALEAQEAAIDAEESADIATAQASIATARATTATTQAGIATTQAGIATTQAGIATTKANQASASAASALASEQAADVDRIAAQTAATTATTQAGIATTQAGIATTQAGISTTQAGIATTQASNALTSANNALASQNSATASASTATTQAGIATTQAGIATTQASNALTSANNAAASAAAAAQVGTSTLLTGLPTLVNTPISATDTILQAFAKSQGQINARVSGTIATGQVAFGTDANTVGGDNGLFWDNTNKRLGVGGSPGAFILDINGTSRVQGALTINNNASNQQVTIESNRGTGSSNTCIFEMRNINATSNKVQVSFGGGTVASGYGRTFSFGVDIGGIGARDFFVYNGATTNTPFIITPNDRVIIGNTGISYSDLGYRLDVNGTARVQSTLKVGAATATNASSVLDLESTTRGFLPPRMTTTEKNAIASPAVGLVVYDTTLNKLSVRGALTWETVTSS
jgi:hypothetical protein